MIVGKQLWIGAGYEVFSREGPDGLKVERLARMVNKSKSSFYHYFAELDIFTAELLSYHLERAAVVVAAEQACRNVIPELVEVLLAYKQDLLFNRQLRVHRNRPGFESCLVKASQDSVTAIAAIWTAFLGVPTHSRLARTVLELSIENFYLQITEEHLTREWLLDYLRRLKQRIQWTMG